MNRVVNNCLCVRAPRGRLNRFAAGIVSMAAGAACLAGGNPACNNAAGSCCSVHNSPGCNDPICCNAVCAAPNLAHCCQVAWDLACANAAAQICGACGAEPVACCSPEGYGCADVPPDLCLALEGIGGLPGSQCAQAKQLCPQVGACCLVDGCAVLPRDQCGTLGGTYAGDGADCLDEDKNGASDMCETQLPPDECNCLPGEDCLGSGNKVEIDNLKKPDVAIVDRNQRLGRKILSKNNNTTVAVVRNIKQAIIAILNKHRQAGVKVNVVVDGHGKPGHQFFGKDKMGHEDDAAKENQELFELATKGKIKHLQLLGCQTGQGNAGQAFLDKLLAAIQCDLVKAFTGIVEKQVPPNKFFVIDGVKIDKVPEQCPWDCGDDNGIVGIVDFLALLSQWQQADTSCDFDGGGVTTTDFLKLLAAWGPCP